MIKEGGRRIGIGERCVGGSGREKGQVLDGMMAVNIGGADWKVGDCVEGSEATLVSVADAGKGEEIA